MFFYYHVYLYRAISCYFDITYSPYVHTCKTNIVANLEAGEVLKSTVNMYGFSEHVLAVTDHVNDHGKQAECHGDEYS